MSAYHPFESGDNGGKLMIQIFYWLMESLYVLRRPFRYNKLILGQFMQICHDADGSVFCSHRTQRSYYHIHSVIFCLSWKI